MKNVLIINSLFFLIGCNITKNNEIEKFVADDYKIEVESKKLRKKNGIKLSQKIAILNKNILKSELDISYGKDFLNNDEITSFSNVKKDNDSLKLFFNTSSLDEMYITLLEKKDKLYITKLYQRDHEMNFKETVCVKDTLIEISNYSKIDFYNLMDNSKWKCKSIITDSITYKETLSR